MAPIVIPRDHHPISRKDIDEEALKVLYRLHRHGFLSYLVGGSVRDLLLERSQKTLMSLRMLILTRSMDSLKIAGSLGDGSDWSIYFLKGERSSRYPRSKSVWIWRGWDRRRWDHPKRKLWNTGRGCLSTRHHDQWPFLQYWRFLHHRLCRWNGWPWTKGHPNHRRFGWKIWARSRSDDPCHPPCCPNGVPIEDQTFQAISDTEKRYEGVLPLDFEMNSSVSWRKVWQNPLSTWCSKQVYFFPSIPTSRGLLEIKAFQEKRFRNFSIPLRPCGSTNQNRQTRIRIDSSCPFSNPFFFDPSPPEHPFLGKEKNTTI